MDEEEIQRATAITTARARFKDLITAYQIIDPVREFVLSRRADIEKDIEDFGMLKPVLNYFLEEANVYS